MVFPVEYFGRLAIPLAIAAFFAGRIPGQMDMYDSILRVSDEMQSKARGEGSGPTEYYDYIIVGAGSAGSVLANRLSANPLNRVLLLESGGDPNPFSDIPYTTVFMGETPMDYAYTTIQQESSCLGLGGICPIMRGRAVGGSSAINAMMYNRCNRNDYDNWANFTGDPIWRFDSVVDGFRAIEDYHGFWEVGENHGTAGEMYVGKLDYLPSLEVWEEALIEKGIPTGDLNSGLFHSGFSKMDYNIKNGLRWGTYQGFIEPVLNRTNLKIYRYAQATKINLNEDNRAIGVTYRRHGQLHYAGCNKEVIVSGGVIESPKLLLLSGIGPRSDLEQLGIQVRVDLPAVGQHLQDHPALDAATFTLNQTFGRDHLTPQTIDEYIKYQTGPASIPLSWKANSIAPLIATGYASSNYNDDPNWPDIHIYVHEQILNLNQADQIDSHFIIIEAARAKSEGSVRLKSTDPNDQAVIDSNYFSDPQDLEVMVDGIEYMLDIFLNTTAYKSVGMDWSGLRDYPVAQCEGFPFPPTRDYWKCVLKQWTLSSLHPTSTCRMGPNSTVAVLDSKLRVFGTMGLRVIDASAFPFVPNGNTNFPAIMIGEMGSRIILETQYS